MCLYSSCNSYILRNTELLLFSGYARLPIICFRWVTLKYKGFPNIFISTERNESAGDVVTITVGFIRIWTRMHKNFDCVPCFREKLEVYRRWYWVIAMLLIGHEVWRCRVDWPNNGGWRMQWLAMWTSGSEKAGRGRRGMSLGAAARIFFKMAARRELC